MNISIGTSKAIALKEAVEGEEVVFSPTLSTYIIERKGYYIDPSSSRVYSRKEVGELRKDSPIYRLDPTLYETRF